MHLGMAFGDKKIELRPKARSFHFELQRLQPDVDLVATSSEQIDNIRLATAISA